MKHQMLGQPLWVWAVVAAAVIVVVAAAASPANNPTQPADTRPAVALPDIQADGCPPVDTDLVALAESHLDTGLTLRVATSGTDADGNEWLIASVYRIADGERVSSADTWVRFDGILFSVSGSANELSDLPDGRDYIVGFDNATRADLEACALAALRTIN